jgi:hypothetical protein
MSFLSDFDGTATLSPIQATSRFDSYFDAYGLNLKQEAGISQRNVTLIARSPASPVAQALAINLGRFEPQSVQVGIIFAQIAPPEALDFLLQSLKTACAQAPETIIRWAKNRALLDAHERLTLGHTLCWTGDSMRRAEDTRSVMDRVDDADPAVLAESRASFTALWKASKALPKLVLSRPCLQSTGDTLRTPQPFEPDMQSQPNIVRLEDYLRGRRH